MPPMRIGDMLVAAGLTTEDQVRQALARQKETGRRLGEELVDLGFVTEAQLTQILSNQLSIPWVSLYHVEFSRELLNLIPAEVADRCGAIPVYVRKVRREGETLFVAMDDPTNLDSLQRIRKLTGMPVKAMVAAPSDIRSAIRVYYFGARPQAEPSSRPRRAMRTSEPPPPAAPPEPQRAPPETGAEEGSPPAEPEAPAPAPPPEPPAERRAEPTAAPKKAEKKQPRMITLTLLDGTTVRLPAPQSKGEAAEAQEDEVSGALTASDLIAALVGRAQGVEVSDVLPDDRWEPLFAALLSLLLRKGLIADWEFVEEWRKRQG